MNFCVPPPERQAASTLYAIGAHIPVNLRINSRNFRQKFWIFSLQVFCKRFAENLCFHTLIAKKNLTKLGENFEKAKFSSNFSPFIAFQRMQHHKSEIYAIPFAAIYEQCTHPTVQAIEDDFIQQIGRASCRERV